MRIADIPLGDGAPLVLIAGRNVIESEADALACAERLQEMSARHGLPLVFKASCDKANRSSQRSFRGPGFDEGLRVLARVKEVTGLPVLTDVHEPHQAKQAAEVVDCLQLPAFLVRQTDLVAACAHTGLPVNVKKAQFMAPADTRHVVDKLAHFGCSEAFVTERGASFGYHNLVVDMRGLVQMREFAPVCLDATHAVQYPSADEHSTGGDRRFVAPLARAAAAVGIDALFLETHDDPDRAPCDGPSQLTAEAVDALLGQVVAIDRAVRG
ncbi:MAG: 3-deoxy-8-phosphooctulonate synthase [Proteobacteria bacterium]|nr:3-deoxy-8-phosphooctulonate synthase [Pseudomonadota bacterium]